MRQVAIAYIILFLIFHVSIGVSGQISVISKQTENIGPGLSIPAMWGTFFGSMNTHIASQDVIISHNEYQYIAYYNEDRYVVMGRRQLCDRNWEFFVFEDYMQTTNDRHNHISIGVCPNDGTIHISFDHHVDTLNYRISLQDLANYPENFEWEAGLFSEVKDYLIPGQIQPRITYPAFFSTTDGHLNMVFRFRGSGNAESYIAFYDGTSHQWEDVHKFIESTGEYQDPYLDYISYSRNAYPFYFIYDDDGWLHTAWVWRESSSSRYNHDINYVRSPDHGRTWFNNDGEVIGKVTDTDTLYIEYASPGLNVWTIDSRYGMINNGGMILDQHGQPHIMVFHRLHPKELTSPSFVSYGDGRHHHYWRTTDGTWHKQHTWFRGSRPRLFSDNKGNMYMTMIDRSDSLDAASPYIVRVAASNANIGWSSWYQIYEGIYNTRKNEPPADPVYLRDQGVFTVVSHEYYDYFLNGPMYVTDLFTNVDHSSKIEIGATKDAYTRTGSNSGNNYGDSHILVVSDHPGDTLERRIYLQFDLEKLNTMNAEGIISAELVLGTMHATNEYNEEDYTLYLLEDDEWEELDINWNNAPEPQEITGTIKGDSLFMRWDITNELIQERSGDGILSLCVIKAEEAGYADLVFHARESSATGLSPKIIVKAESSCLQDIGLLTTLDDHSEEIVDTKVRVFPNPVYTDQINIEGLDNFIGHDVLIEIYDIAGRRIQSEEIDLLPGNALSFTLDHCSNGMHLLSISSSKIKAQNIKLLIQK